jgi:ubiquinol-cytochrome c reductase iron-sulfur subunit
VNDPHEVDYFAQARRARRAEHLIAAAFVVATCCALALVAVYVLGGQVQAEGALLLGTLGGIGVGIVAWAKYFMPEEEAIEERHDLESTPEQIAEFRETYEEGERALGRRWLLFGTAAGAIGALVVALLPPIFSLGPRPKGLRHTAYGKGTTTKGVRLVTADNKPVKAAAVAENGVITCFPEDHVDDANAPTLLIRPDAPVAARHGRESWTPDGLVAYSKLCTHVGCPVGLYQAKSHLLLCPCHQSTFEVLNGAKPVFGPATRALPQLPLEIDSEGYVRAKGDFSSPPGPGFWDRAR